MIRKHESTDFNDIYEIINDAAKAYKGVIPEDRYHEPYMSETELQRQIDDNVIFYCYIKDNKILGVMGLQDKGDVFLIRHAYVRTKQRNKGIGTLLLKHLIHKTEKPLLIGTWEAADWAIRFYQKQGFTKLNKDQTRYLLIKYWSIPERQIETSIVLVDEKAGICH